MKGDRHTVTIGAIVGVLLAALVWLTPPAGAAVLTQQQILAHVQTNLANPNMTLQQVITQALTEATASNIPVQDLAADLAHTLMVSGLAAGQSGLPLATSIAQAFMASLLAQGATGATISRAVGEASLGMWAALHTQFPNLTETEVSTAIETGLQSASLEQYTNLNLQGVVGSNVTTAKAELYSPPPPPPPGNYGTTGQGQVQQFWSKTVSPG